MRVLFLDCFSGISGDMTVGALCDLGVKPSTFEWELSKLDLGPVHLHFERRKRQEIEGVKFGVHAGAEHSHDQDEEPDEHGQVHVHAHEHGHEHADAHAHDHEPKHSHAAESHAHAEDDHDHHHHEHSDEEGGCGRDHGHAHEHAHAHKKSPGRSYAEIRTLIESSDLSDFVKKHALSIFARIATAEAKIHGVTVESVGFHEVGALDSIADIVLACIGIEELAVDEIKVGPLANGRGWVDTAHGRFPIPAPATLEILRGIPVAQIDEPFEFITPTGAAIVAEFGATFGPMPRLKIEKIGYGVGSRETPGRPNVLRAILGEPVPED